MHLFWTTAHQRKNIDAMILTLNILHRCFSAVDADIVSLLGQIGMLDRYVSIPLPNLHFGAQLATSWSPYLNMT